MIDKPSFLWAGGFYLKTLYNLFGLRENEWNLSFSGVNVHRPVTASYTLEFGDKKVVNLSSDGIFLKSLTFGSESIPSAVLPLSAARREPVFKTVFDSLRHSCLYSMNAIVYKISSGADGLLDCEIASFQGHRVFPVVIAPAPPRQALVDGVPLPAPGSVRTPDGQRAYEYSFIAKSGHQHLLIYFK